MRSFTSKCKIMACLLAGFLITVFAVNYADYSFMKTGEIVGSQDFLLKKLNYLKEHKNEFNVLFIGASRTYHGIDAVYFDSLVGKKIPGIKSYNFGAPGLGWTEIFYTLNYINELDPPNLKYIIFEPIPYSKIYAENLETAENLRVHDFKNTFAAVHNIVTSDEQKFYILFQTYYHILSYLRRITCTGCTINYYANKIKLDNHPAPDEIYDDITINSGFIALDDERPFRRKKNEEFMRAAKERMPVLKSELIERIELAENSPDKSNPADYKILSLADIARRSKAEAVMLITPQLFNHHRTEGRVDYLQKLSGMRIWAYNDPRKYPEFLIPEYRWEEQHLSKKGARLLTEILAEDFIKSFAEKK